MWFKFLWIRHFSKGKSFKGGILIKEIRYLAEPFGLVSTRLLSLYVHEFGTHKNILFNHRVAIISLRFQEKFGPIVPIGYGWPGFNMGVCWTPTNKKVSIATMYSIDSHTL